MAKSHIKLPDGTDIIIEGNPDEIAKILELYSVKSEASPRSAGGSTKPHKPSTDKGEMNGDHVLELINTIKECDESEKIEQTILDRLSLVNRILLPLYISHQHFRNEIALQTGEISKILTELGTPVSVSNVAHCIAGSAKSYVAGDKVRKRGQAVKYRITRKGLTYLTAVINGGK
ncbi:MAG: hypothetical protein PHX93_00150 [Candidatus Peribacteraceae bacterium]|jgi:hypothetical protein|nr:hypothetical protein [Candidatus Peribacteraceae bacterium]